MEPPKAMENDALPAPLAVSEVDRIVQTCAERGLTHGFMYAVKFHTGVDTEQFRPLTRPERDWLREQLGRLR